MSDRISFEYNKDKGKTEFNIRYYKFDVCDESKFFEAIKSVGNPSISSTTKKDILELSDKDRDDFMTNNLYSLNKKDIDKWSDKELEAVGIKKSDEVLKAGYSPK